METNFGVFFVLESLLYPDFDGQVLKNINFIKQEHRAWYSPPSSWPSHPQLDEDSSVHGQLNWQYDRQCHPHLFKSFFQSKIKITCKWEVNFKWFSMSVYCFRDEELTLTPKLLIEIVFLAVNMSLVMTKWISFFEWWWLQYQLQTAGS